MRSPSTPLQGSSSSVTTPNTDKKKQKDKKEKKDKDKDKKLKASSTSSSAHSPPGSERGSLRVYVVAVILILDICADACL
jgi:hypothetical protein